MTPRQLVDALGGTSNTARAMLVSRSIVKRWLRKGHVPILRQRQARVILKARHWQHVTGETIHHTDLNALHGLHAGDWRYRTKRPSMK